MYPILPCFHQQCLQPALSKITSAKQVTNKYRGSAIGNNKGTFWRENKIRYCDWFMSTDLVQHSLCTTQRHKEIKLHYFIHIYVNSVSNVKSQHSILKNPGSVSLTGSWDQYSLIIFQTLILQPGRGEAGWEVGRNGGMEECRRVDRDRKKKRVVIIFLYHVRFIIQWKYIA